MSGAENAISPLSLSTEIIPSANAEENAIDVIFPLLHDKMVKMERYKDY